MFTIYSHEVNLWAVLVCGILSLAIGYVWYLPQVFGNIWMRENNLKPEDLNASDYTPYIISFVSFTILALVLAWVMQATVADTLFSSLRIAVSLWAGFTLAPFVTNYRFSRRSWLAIAVDAGYALVAALLFAVILWAW